MARRNQPRYQYTPVSLEIFSIICSRSVVNSNGGVPVGLKVLFKSFAITVPFGRNGTSSAVSWELPPTRTWTQPARSTMFAMRFRNATCSRVLSKVGMGMANVGKRGVHTCSCPLMWGFVNVFERRKRGRRRTNLVCHRHLYRKSHKRARRGRGHALYTSATWQLY